MTTASGADFTALPDLASRALGRQRGLRQRRAVRRAGEPHPARARRLLARGLRPQGQDLRRLGDPPAPRARLRPRHRPARRAPGSCAAWSSTRPGSAATTRRTPRSRPPSIEGHPSPDELAGADWVTLVERSPIAGRHGQRVPGRRRAPVHPRPADDLPRRRGRPVPGPRRAGARPALPRRHRRPGRAGARRRRRRLLQPVLLLAAQHPAARPGPHHGRGLGERPPPRRRQRPRLGPPRRARPGRAGRGRHVLLRRQRRRLGLAARHRRALATTCPAPATGWSWCRGPGCSRTPATCSGSPRRRRSRTCGSTCSPTAAWPGCGCTAPCRRRTGPPGCAAGSTCCRQAHAVAGPRHRRRPAPGRGGGDGGRPAAERHRPAARGGRPAPARLTR